MKNKNKINFAHVICALLGSMSRDELRNIATVANVPRGKDRTDTVGNLTAAISKGQLQLKGLFTLQLPPKDGQSFKKPLVIKKLRSYKPEKTYLVAKVSSSAPAPAAVAS